jgi:hypothetical protein
MDDSEVHAMALGGISAEIVLWRSNMSIRAKHAQQGGSGDGEPAYVVWDIL